METQLAIDDFFTVCDMGGGTVDLISYRVASINPIVVEEATVGTGDQCGASFIDREFLTWLEKRLGPVDFQEITGCKAEDVSHTCLAERLASIVKAFTAEENGFGDEDVPGEIYLSLPYPLNGIDNDAKRGIERGKLVINQSEMEHFFEDTLSKTLELLRKQFQQPEKKEKPKIKYVFMVGGFAMNKYMHRKIADFALKYSEIPLYRPLNAWAAIAMGAALKGAERESTMSVKLRKCRRHYGTDMSDIFNPKKHLEEDSFIDEYMREKMANNQMGWLISKGQDLATSDTFHGSKAFYETLWVEEDRKVYIDLLAADVDEAPTRSISQDVYKLAEPMIDLTPVPLKTFHKRRSPTENPFLTLDNFLDITILSTIQFSMSVGNVKYGSVEVKYD